jgi:hypothetical protein
MARCRRPELGQPTTHGALVLREQQGMRAGAAGVPLCAQRRQVLGRYMLVVEGDDGAVPSHGPQVVEVEVVTDDGVADDLRGGDVRPFDQHPQRYAERDSGRLHHAGELATTDDRDPGSTHRRHGRCACLRVHGGRVARGRSGALVSSGQGWMRISVRYVPCAGSLGREHALAACAHRLRPPAASSQENPCH